MYNPQDFGALCKSCPLGPKGCLRKGTKENWDPVPPELHKGADVLAVVECPSVEDVRIGRPLVGDSGMKWNELLREVGSRRPEVDIDHVIACKPPGGSGGAYKRMEKTLVRLRKRKIKELLATGQAASKADAVRQAFVLMPNPSDCCAPRLDRMTSGYTKLLGLGSTAYQALTGQLRSISSVQGGPMELTKEGQPPQKLMPLFHPSYILRSRSMERFLTHGLAKAFRHFNDALLWVEPDQLYQPTPEAIEEWLSQPAPFWVVDIETDGIETSEANIDCIGFAIPDLGADGKAVKDLNDTTQVCRTMGFSLQSREARQSGSHYRYYSPQDEEAIRLIVGRFLNDPTKLKVGHNLGAFDNPILERWVKVKVEPFIDTVLAARFAAPDMPKGLKPRGVLLTDIDRWESSEKGTKIATGQDSDEELLIYCAKGDCGVNARITMPLLVASQEAGAFRDLDPVYKPPSWGDKAWNLWEIDHGTQAMCRKLRENGVPVDQELRSQLELRFEVSVIKRRAKLNDLLRQAGITSNMSREELAQVDFKPGSYDQVREVMYNNWQLGCPSQLRLQDFYTDTGLPGTGDEVLRAHLASARLSDVQRAFIEELRLYRRERNKILGSTLHILRLRSIDRDKGLVLGDGRVHPSWNSHTTSVARLSCSHPNLQTIGSRKGLSFLKNLFAPKEGRLLLGADYDQLHLRIIANYWKIPVLQEAFTKGIDPHNAMAYAIFGKRFKNADGWGPEGMDLTRKPKDRSAARGMREVAKTFRYAVAYGADYLTAWATLTATETLDEEAWDRGEYRTKMPYIEMTPAEVKLFYKRWRRIEPEWVDAWQHMKNDFDVNGWLESPLFNRRSGGLDGGKDEAVYNFRILACETDIVRMAEPEVQTAFPFGYAGHGTGMVLQTHDSIDVEVPDPGTEEGREKLCHELEEAMTITIPGWDVPFTANASTGKSLADI